jgi:hypothetical protein
MTGHGAPRTILSATLPINNLATPPRPAEAMTTRPTSGCALRYSRISRAGIPILVMNSARNRSFSSDVSCASRRVCAALSRPSR